MLTRSEVVGRVAESCYTYMQVTLVGLTGFGVWGQLTTQLTGYGPNCTLYNCEHLVKHVCAAAVWGKLNDAN